MEQKAAGRKILIAVDSSEHSNRAFDWYLKNIHQEGDHVYVVTVVELVQKINTGLLPGNYSVERITEIAEQAKAESTRIETMLAGYVDLLRPKRIACEARQINESHVGDSICKFAEENGASMIVMGTRGQGKLRRTMLGSVSDFIVHHSKIPCVIIH
ncbi:universal stress protein YxiE-like [Ylistrum balloti]|uniref:universal stress protein YxiE-like n=1 Tax=Ylistrum balloti TaxID=509963 RepID=UPI0029058EEE|nr:universal stress protein YxiE-like [Ylistrum balloti]